MGTGQSDLYQGTYGDNPENIPDELKSKIKLPTEESQLNHIFRDAEGHLQDTPENRQLLLEVANDKALHLGKDGRGNDWHGRILDDGSQVWVCSRNGVIQNGGINNPPRIWDDNTGLNNNPFRGNGDE